MTKQKTTYHKPPVWRVTMSVVAILCVLLSSCVAKSNLKKLFGVGHPIGQSHNSPKKNANLFTMSGSGHCLYNQVSEEGIVQKSDLKLPGNVFVATAYPDISSFGFDFRFDQGKKKDLRFDRKGFSNYAVPVFLQFRKLII